jgi:surfeit locus 1 family protein
MKKALLYLIAILLIMAMISLGFWQLSRADEKQQIYDYFISQTETELDLNLNRVTQENLYQQAAGEGQYLATPPLFIDSQSQNGRVGYHVLKAFQFDDSEQIVLVNLGWVQMGLSRDEKPEIDVPYTSLRVKGRLQKPHAKPPVWSDETPIIQQGAFQYLNLPEAEQFLGVAAIAPLILELEPSLDNVGGLDRQWLKFDDKWIDRHKAYALQWFSLATAFFILCLVVELRSRKSQIKSK